MQRINWTLGALAAGGVLLCQHFNVHGVWWMLPGMLAGWFCDSVFASRYGS